MINYPRCKDILVEIGTEVQSIVMAQLQTQSTDALSLITHESEADTIFAIDSAVEEVLLPLLEEKLAPYLSFVLICEGVSEESICTFPKGTPENDCSARLIIDPIDGTRPIMYNKRSAWWLAGLAPNKGTGTTLDDIELAVQVELPTTRAAYADTFWAIRGNGVDGFTRSLLDGVLHQWAPRPSKAPTVFGGFASFFCPFPRGKRDITAIEEELLENIGANTNHKVAHVFRDEYLSTGGQLYDLIMGKDRFLADIRGVIYEKYNSQGKARGVACHPYDLCTALIAQEAGVIITDGRGEELTAPLDTTTDVSWIGYANHSIQKEVEPELKEILKNYLNNKGVNT